jgi:hypothetical protein
MTSVLERMLSPDEFGDEWTITELCSPDIASWSIISPKT